MIARRPLAQGRCRTRVCGQRENAGMFCCRGRLLSSPELCYDGTRVLRIRNRRGVLRRFAEDDARAGLACLGRREQPSAVTVDDAPRDQHAHTHAVPPLVEDGALAVLLRLERGERLAVSDPDLVAVAIAPSAYREGPVAGHLAAQREEDGCDGLRQPRGIAPERG